jgi:hypothetical protein
VRINSTFDWTTYWMLESFASANQLADGWGAVLLFQRGDTLPQTSPVDLGAAAVIVAVVVVVAKIQILVSLVGYIDVALLEEQVKTPLPQLVLALKPVQERLVVLLS